MSFGKSVGRVAAGAGIGFFVGILLFIPSCLITAANHKFDTTMTAEAITVRMFNNIVPFCAIGGLVIGLVLAIKDKEKESIEKKKAEEAVRKQKEGEQHAVRTELINLCTTALGEFEYLPKRLIAAEQCLDQAEIDFKENAFSPFWNSIEQATTQLGFFDNSVLSIGECSQRHRALAMRYEGPSPHFPISLNSVHGMGASANTSDRLKSVVRIAQSNPTFAMIYEQRRTNQILVAGFNSLAQALDGMGQKIASSIDGLSREISTMSSNLDQSLEELTTGIEELHSTMQKTASDQAERDSDQAQRHKAALSMLDNIQRRRIPYPRKFGDRAY